MHLLAPAKINLHLRVAPVTTDGFHPLASWMCSVGLFDTLVVESTSAGQPTQMRCDEATLACDQSNLVVRAADAMSAAMSRAIGVGSPPSSLNITLEKRIPTGGGLGGGSSDAARMVLGLNRLWQLNWPVDRLSEIAATLGSDVAFFCHGPSSACTGRGQIVKSIAAPKPGYVVLFLPPISVPTGPVYRRFDELLTAADAQALRNAVANEPDWNAWTQLNAEQLLPLLVNDLERPAFDLHPALNQLRMTIELKLGRIVRMSGSGSSLFTLFDEQEQAERAADTIATSLKIRTIAARLAPEIEDDLM